MTSLTCSPDPTTPGAPCPLSPVPREFSGACVALVGDQSPVMPTLARELHRAGISVRESAGAVVLRASGNPPDLVFLHLGRAPLDAIATARALRHRGLAAPLVGVSAGPCPVPEYACFNAGMDDLMELPLDGDTLWGCLTRWLQPRR